MVITNRFTSNYSLLTKTSNAQVYTAHVGIESMMELHFALLPVSPRNGELFTEQFSLCPLTMAAINVTD